MSWPMQRVEAINQPDMKIMCFCLQCLNKRMKTECPLGLRGSRLGMGLAACWSIWSAAVEA